LCSEDGEVADSPKSAMPLHSVAVRKALCGLSAAMKPTRLPGELLCSHPRGSGDSLRALRLGVRVLRIFRFVLLEMRVGSGGLWSARGSVVLCDGSAATGLRCEVLMDSRTMPQGRAHSPSGRRFAQSADDTFPKTALKAELHGGKRLGRMLAQHPAVTTHRDSKGSPESMAFPFPPAPS
jgi:hypothetical protein